MESNYLCLGNRKYFSGGRGSIRELKKKEKETVVR